MFGFTDLEDRFLGAEGRSALHAALESIRGVGSELRAAIAGGLPKDDFAQAEMILAAAGAAEHILLNAANLKGA